MTGNLDTSKWTPRSPPLQFPSKYYMSQHGPENNDWRRDYNDGAIPHHPLIHQLIIIREVMRNYKNDIIKNINNM